MDIRSWVIGLLLSLLALAFFVKFMNEKPRRPAYIIGSVVWFALSIAIMLRHWH